MKKLLSIFFGLILIAFFVSHCQAQNNSNQNGAFFYKNGTQDTTALKNYRSLLQTAYGNSSGLIFDKANNKWRVWDGSDWVDWNLFNSSGIVQDSSQWWRTRSDFEVFGDRIATTEGLTFEPNLLNNHAFTIGDYSQFVVNAITFNAAVSNGTIGTLAGTLLFETSTGRVRFQDTDDGSQLNISGTTVSTAAGQSLSVSAGSSQITATTGENRLTGQTVTLESTNQIELNSSVANILLQAATEASVISPNSSIYNSNQTNGIYADDTNTGVVAGGNSITIDPTTGFFYAGSSPFLVGDGTNPSSIGLNSTGNISIVTTGAVAFGDGIDNPGNIDLNTTDVNINATNINANGTVLKIDVITDLVDNLLISSSDRVIISGTNGAALGTVPTTDNTNFNLLSRNSATGTIEKNVNIFQSSYDPTFTAGANVATVTDCGQNWVYTRLGNMVTVQACISVDPTAAANTLTQFEFDLPVASNFTSFSDGTGVCADSFTVAGENTAVQMASNSSSDRMAASFYSKSTNALTLYGTFIYQVK